MIGEPSTAPQASPKPTVGRIVHFYSDAIGARNGGAGLNGQGKGPYPAIVQQTFSGPYVNLKVLGWGVEAWDEGSVSEREPGNDARCWVWPPRA